jgi:hypothetical protein
MKLPTAESGRDMCRGVYGCWYSDEERYVVLDCWRSFLAFLVIYFTEHGSSSDAQIQVTPLTGLGITVIRSSLPEMYEGEIA